MLHCFLDEVCCVLRVWCVWRFCVQFVDSVLIGSEAFASVGLVEDLFELCLQFISWNISCVVKFCLVNDVCHHVGVLSLM